MEPPLWQRLVAPLMYLLPWSDAIPLGFGPDGLFLQYPVLLPLVLPALPLMQLERSIPFGLGGLLLGTLSSAVVVAVLAILLFSLVECLRGREPDLPGISQAVRMQLY